MAKKSMIARDLKRKRIAAKYANKRLELKNIINDRSADPAQVDEALALLREMGFPFQGADPVIIGQHAN